MSTTRHAQDDDRTFHQERYSSAVEFEKGLLANLVAKRSEPLDAADRELVWFLQSLSHREGLEKVASDLVVKFRSQVGPAAMRKVGMEPGTVYTASQVKAIRQEIPQGRDLFPLTGELTKLERQAAIARQLLGQHSPEERRLDGYRLESILERSGFNSELARLPQLLAQLCTDPAFDIKGCRPWYFPDLVQCLRDYMRDWISARQTVITKAGEQIGEALDYSLRTGFLSLIEGLPGRGKTFAARAYCETHPGQARYVQVPSTTDNIGFFRAIAKAIGSASALSLNVVQLRERVEAALQDSKLMLVMDEAHYLWSQSQRRSLPSRINWIMTALVNFGVPVALVTTPQFMRDLKIIEQRTGWMSDQFRSRVRHIEKLPEVVSQEDLKAVAKAMLPAADKDSIQALVLYGQASGNYLRAIETAVKGAVYIAAKEGRATPAFKDIRSAIGHVLPVDRRAAKDSIPSTEAGEDENSDPGQRFSASRTCTLTSTRARF